MNAEAAVLEVLKANAGVAALAGARCYDSHLPQPPTLPAVVIVRTGGQRYRTLAGFAGTEAPTFRLSSHALTAAQARALEDAAVSALDGFRGTAAGVKVGAVTVAEPGDGPTFDETVKGYRTDRTLTVWTREG